MDGAEELGDAAQLGWALFLLGFTLLWYGSLDEAEDAMLRALVLAERSGRALVRSMCTTYLTVLFRKRGDADSVRTWNERSLNAALEAERTEYVAMAAANRAWLAWKEENLSAAEAEARSAVTDWQGLSPPIPICSGGPGSGYLSTLAFDRTGSLMRSRTPGCSSARIRQKCLTL